MVISQVQVGSSVSASNEFVELYNNGLSDTEITNWCVTYASSTSTQNGSKLACFLPESEHTYLYLPSHSYAFLASKSLLSSTPGLGSDLSFVAGMAATAGHVRLLDESSVEVDKVGWGAAAASAEGNSPILAPPSGSVLQRKYQNLEILQDTNSNGDDFELAMPRTSYAFGAISEVVDICLNIDGIQVAVPADYAIDTVGICSPPPIDICITVEGIQVTLPIGYEFDQAGQCQPDSCLNLAGLQTAIPSGYAVGTNGICTLELLPIKITELLANPAGSDTDREFVELYNPGSTRVDLGLYRLRIGTDTPKLYEFPVGSSIESGEYKTFDNSKISYTLLNSSQVVAVVGQDGVLIDQAVPYQDPVDDATWALIGDTWQYTNQPTPGGPNLASLVDATEVVTEESSVVQCAANQYRNSETGRCRLLITESSSVLATCKDGQYRSEETNRCRNIVSDVVSLVPCKEGQERNPETGRCRLISAVLGAALAACKEGQERNPETNRCRNITAAVSSADYPVEPTAASSGGYWGWLAFGGVGVLTAGYGVWEWRSEIMQGSTKLRRFFHLKK